MMKRLLVLMLVLGISSVASAVDVVDIVISSVSEPGDILDPFAAVTNPIDPTDNITIAPSQWVNLDIIYTDDGSGIGLISLAVDIIVTGPATLHMGEVGAAYYNTLLTFPPGAWDLGITPAPISFIEAAGTDLAMSNGLMGVVGVPVIALDHILLHCEAEGLVTVTVVNNADASSGGTFNMAMGMPAYGPGVTITQVPEPMTLALLGLGGLFLVRRRK